MALASAPAQETQTLVVKESTNPTIVVGKMVGEMLAKQSIFLPTDYSPENALKQAYLLLQGVKDRNNNPVLTSCSRASIINALLDMVVQGLNPAKKQCYFIAYGSDLACQRSYFGDVALAQRVKPGIEPYSGVIYDGDEFEMEIIRGRTTVARHKTAFGNQDKDIKGAYMGFVSPDGEDLGCVIMTLSEIQASWGMSKTYKPDGNGTHNKFPAQMCIRTVTRKRCKPIINSSSDALLLESVLRQEMGQAEGEVDEVVEEFSNSVELPIGDAPQGEPKGEPAQDQGQKSEEDAGF